MKTALVLVLLAADILASCSPQAPPAPAQVGRYIIAHSPQVERDTILLDTVTGQSWQEVSISDATNEPTVWVPVAQMNGPKDWAALYAAHPAVAPKEVPVEGNPFAGSGPTSR
jgi:hypothetical protein